MDDNKVEAILEAGRWAPSFGNSQPWEFIVVNDATIKHRMNDIAQRVTMTRGIEDASVVIVICVDPSKDSSHFVEAGAVTTQNMALAAQSLGLASYWIGIYSLKWHADSPEETVKKLLNIPKKYRVIAFLPIGIPRTKNKNVKERKELGEIVHYDIWKPVKSYRPYSGPYGERR